MSDDLFLEIENISKQSDKIRFLNVIGPLVCRYIYCVTQDKINKKYEWQCSQGMVLHLKVKFHLQYCKFFPIFLFILCLVVYSFERWWTRYDILHYDKFCSKIS